MSIIRLSRSYFLENARPLTVPLHQLSTSIHQPSTSIHQPSPTPPSQFPALNSQLPPIPFNFCPGKTMIFSTDQILFSLQRIGEVLLPAKRGEVVFSGTFNHRHRGQEIFLALVETTAMGQPDERSPGLGIRIDLQTGLIMDLLNDQGVLGYLPYRTLAPHQDIPFSIEMDLIGRVCVPRLVIGGEIILHPALYLITRGSLSALTGLSLHPPGQATFTDLHLTSSVEQPTEICVAV